MKKVAFLLAFLTLVGAGLAFGQEARASENDGFVIGWGLNSGGQRCTYAQCLIIMREKDGITTIKSAQVSANAYSCQGHSYNFGQTTGFGWDACPDPNPGFFRHWSCSLRCDSYVVSLQLRETCPNGISYKWSPKKQVTLYTADTVDAGTFRTDSAPGCQTLNLADFQVTKAALRQLKLRRAVPSKHKPSDQRERLRRIVKHRR